MTGGGMNGHGDDIMGMGMASEKTVGKYGYGYEYELLYPFLFSYITFTYCIHTSPFHPFLVTHFSLSLLIYILSFLHIPIRRDTHYSEPFKAPHHLLFPRISVLLRYQILPSIPPLLPHISMPSKQHYKGEETIKKQLTVSNQVMVDL